MLGISIHAEYFELFSARIDVVFQRICIQCCLNRHERERERERESESAVRGIKQSCCDGRWSAHVCKSIVHCSATGAEDYNGYFVERRLTRKLLRCIEKSFLPINVTLIEFMVQRVL